ncbi:MAG: GNAT family N-acetyltransferase [Bacillota bacterium]
MYEIKVIDEIIRPAVIKLIIESWGSAVMVTRGRLHYMDRLPGYVALKDGEIKGLITYYIDNEQCEITSLDSFEENKGIGSKLLVEVRRTAEKSGCKRLWLITTNDNTNALRFYQKKGWNLCAIHLNAVDMAREIKPQIPLLGFDGIPIKHEIELELEILKAGD